MYSSTEEFIKLLPKYLEITDCILIFRSDTCRILLTYKKNSIFPYDIHFLRSKGYIYHPSNILQLYNSGFDDRISALKYAKELTEQILVKWELEWNCEKLMENIY